MSRAAQEWAMPEDAGTRLAKLGLTLPGMQEAVVAYRVGLTTATANDPRNAAGYFGYAYATRWLREHLLPQGWRKCDAGGYSRVVNDNRRIAIAVSSGDENTGRIGGEAPRTKRSKGPRTVAAIAANVQQLWLFGDEEIGVSAEARTRQTKTGDVDDFHDVEQPAQEFVPVDGCVTWLLLLHVTHAEIRAELSLPVEVDETARPGQWLERIILPPTTFDSTLAPLDLPDDGPDIDVAVTRRPR